MKMHNHNGLHIKKKLAPEDYRRDPNCKIVNPRTGQEVTIPVILLIALREGKLELRR